MSNTQSKQSNAPKISMFDKKGQANFNRVIKNQSVQINQNKVNLPQFRINQHKGA